MPTPTELLALPRIDLNGVPFYTDIDQQFFSPSETLKQPYQPWLESITRLGYAFIPAKLDELDTGTYHVARYMREGHEPLELQSQEVIVRPVEHGAVVEDTSFGRVVIVGGKVGREALSLIGWEFDACKNMLAAPTPLTFKTAMEAHGAQVKLFPNDGDIPVSHYLQSFAGGEYPVASGKSEYFFHDAANDHAPAILLGKEDLLRGTLAPIAQAALRQSAAAQGAVAEGVDRYTSELALAAFNLPQALQSVVRIGEDLDVSAKQSRELVEVMRDRALYHGIQPYDPEDY